MKKRLAIRWGLCVLSLILAFLLWHFSQVRPMPPFIVGPLALILGATLAGLLASFFQWRER